MNILKTLLYLITGFSWNNGSKDLLFVHLAAGIKGAFTRFKLTGGSDGVLGGVLAGDFGDATFAAMTNLETENKKGDKNEVEEEEEEVYGIFTGKILFLFFICIRIIFFISETGKYTVSYRWHFRRVPICRLWRKIRRLFRQPGTSRERIRRYCQSCWGARCHKRATNFG